LGLVAKFKPEGRNVKETEGRKEMTSQIKQILYATDLTKNSSYAFQYAIDMATRYDAKIVILHAIQPIPPNVYYEGGLASGGWGRIKEKEQEADTEQIKKHLQEFCKRAETQIGPACVERVSNILVPIGHPVDEILKAADGEGCDVIVLGTHGKGFLAHTFLGSVASSVLERTRKPVFIVPLPSEKITLEWDGL
jgi:nucleotide-binding universal stress UspA family protein